MSPSRKKMIMVSSITYAYKARDFLFNKGIKCYIERVPAHLRANGCGYGLKVDNDAELIADMLEDAGIRVKDIFELY